MIALVIDYVNLQFDERVYLRPAHK